MTSTVFTKNTENIYQAVLGVLKASIICYPTRIPAVSDDRTTVKVAHIRLWIIRS